MSEEAAVPPISDVRVTNIPLPIKGDVNVTNVPLPIKGDVNVVNTPTVKLADGTRVEVTNVPPISPLTVGKRFQGGDIKPFTVLETRVGNWVKVRGIPPGSTQEADFLLNLNLVGFLFELR